MLLHLSQLPLCRSKAVNALLLVLAQPGLGGFSQNSLSEVVDEMSDHDECKRNGVHPVHRQMEDAQTNDNTPEIARQERNVHEGGTGEAVEDGHQAVEEGEDQSVANHVAGDFAVPGRGFEGVPVENAGLGTVDKGCPEGQLPDDLVERTAGNEPFFVDVGEAVTGGPDQSKKVAFQLISGGNVAAIRTGDVVGGKQETHAADTDKNTENLSPMVTHMEEEERYHDHDHDGPEVDQLSRENRGVSICENRKVIAFDVKKRQDDICAAGQYERHRISL